MSECVKRITLEEFIRAVFHAVILKGGKVVGAAIEGHRQSAAGRSLAKQNIRKCRSALCAGIKLLQDGVAMLVRASRIFASCLRFFMSPQKNSNPAPRDFLEKLGRAYLHLRDLVI